MQTDLLNKALISLGLTDFDAKIYFYLLKEDSPNIAKLALKLGVQRLKVYNSLDKMVTLDILKLERESKNRFYKVESPTKISALLKQKESQIHSITNNFEEIIPELLSQYQLKKKDSTVKIYTTKNGFLEFFEQVLIESDGQIYHFGNEQQIFDLMSENYAEGWIQNRVKKGIKTREIIFPSFEIQKRLTKNSEELRELKFLDKKLEVNGSYLIYGNKVGLWNNTLPKVVVIEDRVVVSLLKLNFELLWNYL